MPVIGVDPDQLNTAAMRIKPSGPAMTGAGTTIQSTVSTPVGLPTLDEALTDLALIVGGWLVQAGTDLDSLALDTQLASDVYAQVEIDNGISTKTGRPLPLMA